MSETQALEARGLRANTLDTSDPQDHLVQARELNQILLDSMPCAALLLKAGTYQIVASNRMARQIGAVPGTTCYAGLWKRTKPCPWCRAPQAIASGQALNFELSLDGKVWINSWLPVSKDLYLHYVVDHTEQVRVREALRQSEEKFKAIADYTVDWESWLSPEGKLLWVNPAVERFTGYSVAECQAMPEYPIPLIHEKDRDRIRSLLDPNAAGNSRKSNVEFRYVRKDGVTEWGAISWQPIQNSTGKSLGIRASIYDITDRKQSEQKLSEYQKELRSLVSRISMAEEQERRRIADNLHDHLGQSLVFAKMKVDMLNRADLPPIAGAALGQISEILGGLIRTTQSITYDLSYPVLYERGLIEAIEEWIREEYTPKYAVGVSFHPDAETLDLPTEQSVFAYRAVRELLINVAKHARTASATVTLRRKDGRLQICVQDDGAGFDPDKSPDKSEPGQHYGLFSIRERLDHLGGIMTLDSRPGKGTCITLILPEQSTSERSKSHGSSNSAGGRS